MITFTDSAMEKIKEGAASTGTECAGLRVRALKVGKYTFKYHFGLLEAPELQVVLLNRPGSPLVGVGEGAMGPAPAAIANAIFAATGTRIREMPFRRSGISV